MTKTMVVNLYGGPGIGKSTTTAGVFSLLKMHDVNCEIAAEYAKDRAWEESLLVCYNPFYILGKQYQRQFRLMGKVDVILTDSPLLLQAAYSDEKEFQDLAKHLSDKFDNTNIILRRLKKFNPKGRAHDLEQAIALDKKMYEVLDKYNQKYEVMDGNFYTVNKIVENILKDLGKEQKYFMAQDCDSEFQDEIDEVINGHLRKKLGHI